MSTNELPEIASANSLKKLTLLRQKTLMQEKLI